MNLVIGNDTDLVLKAQAIRKHVFVIEQGIPLQLDLDGLDEKSYHSLISIDEKLIGTARLTVVTETHAVLARIAVMKEFRGAGVARKLVNSLLAYAKELRVKSVEIHAHQYLQHYYESFGFAYIKDVEVVGEHQLIEMRLDVVCT